jgi:hypothetical protein
MVWEHLYFLNLVKAIEFVKITNKALENRCIPSEYTVLLVSFTIHLDNISIYARFKQWALFQTKDANIYFVRCHKCMFLSSVAVFFQTHCMIILNNFALLKNVKKIEIERSIPSTEHEVQLFNPVYKLIEDCFHLVVFNL